MKLSFVFDFENEAIANSKDAGSEQLFSERQKFRGLRCRPLMDEIDALFRMAAPYYVRETPLAVAGINASTSPTVLPSLWPIT